MYTNTPHLTRCARKRDMISLVVRILRIPRSTWRTAGHPDPSREAGAKCNVSEGGEVTHRKHYRLPFPRRLSAIGESRRLRNWHKGACW